jgi:hypothetical protein
MVAEVFGFAWYDWGPSNPKFLTREEVMGKRCVWCWLVVPDMGMGQN